MAAQRVGIDTRDLRRFRWLHKAQAVRRSGHRLRFYLPFIFISPEPDNFTFEIANQAELGAWVARVARCDVDRARQYVTEPANDQTLQTWLRTATRGHWLWSKRQPPFGKRLGWYALARALDARLIIEIGAHDGLGSMLLLRALELNCEEGHPGRLVSFDINPKAGWLVGAHPLWDLRIEDSHDGLDSLLDAETPVDLFIYDGWHSYAAERSDLLRARDHLSSGGALLSDDAQVTQALEDLCREHKLAYFAFQEAPVAHFHPGAVLAAGRAR
jgi:hypothetical protein